MKHSTESMVTMADIARKAGVSRSTASFVINNGKMAGRVNADTRQRVVDAARELGYRRNELARAIVTGRNFVLGYLQADACEQESRILEGVLREAATAGYLVKVISHGSLESYHEVTRHCLEQRLAGLIIRRFQPTEVDALGNDLVSNGIPFLFVDDNREVSGAGYVTSDDEQGIRLAIEHLIELGHQAIAFIAGDPQYPQTRIREGSYCRTMQEHGLSVAPEWILSSNWGFKQAEDLTIQLFQRQKTHPTALICDGDTLAAVAIRVLRHMGKNVPEDVSIVGYGGFVFSEVIDPPLTTIAQPFEEIGRVAVQHLLQLIEEEKLEDSRPPHRTLTTHLIVRQSTAPVAVQGKVLPR